MKNKKNRKIIKEQNIQTKSRKYVWAFKAIIGFTIWRSGDIFII